VSTSRPPAIPSSATRSTAARPRRGSRSTPSSSSGRALPGRALAAYSRQRSRHSSRDKLVAVHTICSSRVSQVTVHARGAWVTRTLTLPGSLPDEDVELVAPDVTPLADAGSVRAVVKGTRRRVVSVQTALAVPETTATPGETAARVRELGRRLERLQSGRDRLNAHRHALPHPD